MKLVSLVKSPNPAKKWRANFEDDSGKTFHTDFGDSSMEDYTQHKDKQRREAYRSRHAKDLQTQDPTRAGFLSYYLLWGNSTSLNSNLSDYRKKYNL